MTDGVQEPRAEQHAARANELDERQLNADELAAEDVFALPDRLLLSGQQTDAVVVNAELAG